MEQGRAGLYVQFGCGLCAPDGWVNFDASPTLRLQRVPLLGPLALRAGPRFPPAARYGDIVRGLPLAEASCAMVYCSHVLEHLALLDLRTALRNVRRLLRPGGTFRLVLPDLEALARSYLSSADVSAAATFMEASHLGVRARASGIPGRLRASLGNSAHLWMWDYKGLAAELSSAGFVRVRRAEMRDNPDPRLAAVEEPGRWNNSLGMEAWAPGGGNSPV